MTEAVLMCCFVWANAHLLGWGYSSMEQENDDRAGKLQNSGKTCSSAISSITNLF
jgi:hypothetical protein